MTMMRRKVTPTTRIASTAGAALRQSGATTRPIRPTKTSLNMILVLQCLLCLTLLRLDVPFVLSAPTGLTPQLSSEFSSSSSLATPPQSLGSGPGPVTVVELHDQVEHEQAPSLSSFLRRRRNLKRSGGGGGVTGGGTATGGTSGYRHHSTQQQPGDNRHSVWITYLVPIVVAVTLCMTTVLVLLHCREYRRNGGRKHKLRSWMKNVDENKTDMGTGRRINFSAETSIKELLNFDELVQTIKNEFAQSNRRSSAFRRKEQQQQLNQLELESNQSETETKRRRDSHDRQQHQQRRTSATKSNTGNGKASNKVNIQSGDYLIKYVEGREQLAHEDVISLYIVENYHGSGGYIFSGSRPQFELNEGFVSYDGFGWYRETRVLPEHNTNNTARSGDTTAAVVVGKAGTLNLSEDGEVVEVMNKIWFDERNWDNASEDLPRASFHGEWWTRSGLNGILRATLLKPHESDQDDSDKEPVTSTIKRNKMTRMKRTSLQKKLEMDKKTKVRYDYDDYYDDEDITDTTTITTSSTSIGTGLTSFTASSGATPTSTPSSSFSRLSPTQSSSPSLGCLLNLTRPTDDDICFSVSDHPGTMKLHSIIRKCITEKEKYQNNEVSSSSNGGRHSSDHEGDLTFNAMVYNEIRKQLGKKQKSITKGSGNIASSARRFFVFDDSQKERKEWQHRGKRDDRLDEDHQHDSSDEEISDMLSWRQITSDQEIVKLIRREYNTIKRQRKAKSSPKKH